MDFNQRISNFQKKLKDNKLDGFIVTNPTNIFYLTGFRGVSLIERESVLVFNLYPSKPSQTRQSGTTLITARLYQNEAVRVKSHSLKVKIVDERNKIFEFAKTLLFQKHPRGVAQVSSRLHPGGKTKINVGFEQQDLKFSEYQHLKKDQSLKKLIPIKNLIEDLRLIKTDEEIRKIEKAQIISQKAYSQLLKTIKPGQTEAEIAERLSKIILSLAADGLAFESIVASGRNSSLPHWQTGKQKIKKGQVLLLDFGAKYKDYCADLTRTVFIGRAKDHQKNIFYHVLAAQKRALEKIAHGQKASEAYHLVHTLFKKQKLHQYFLHGLGHGVGLDVHENPYLRPTRNEPLLENMVFSVEPGLYLPWGGIRIEDLVLVKNGRAKILGKQTDKAIEI